MHDPTETFVNEGEAFINRHRTELSETGQAWGGLVWGLMRAVAECPEHPGHFRVPLDKEWNRLICPVDHTVWEKPTDGG